MSHNGLERTVLTQDQIGSAIPWLKSVLESKGITLNPASDLARAFRAMDDFHIDVSSGKTVMLRSDEDFARFATQFSEISGVDFLSKALRRTWGKVRGADAHLRHLCSADPLPTTPTTRPGDRVKDRNCVWELGLAALTAVFVDDVALEDPPDIVYSFHKRSGGIAAKYLYSDKPGKQAERIVDGADQLERAGVENGFVILNLVQQFPLGRMLRNFADGKVTPEASVPIVDGWCSAFMDPILRQLGDSFRTRPKTLAVLSFVPVVCPYEGGLAPLYRVSVTSIEGRDAAASEFIYGFHDASQTVLASP